MKRVISLLLALALVFALCACANGEKPAEGTADAAASKPEETGGSTVAAGDGAVAEQGTQASTDTAVTATFTLPTDLPRVKLGAVGAWSMNELYHQWKSNLESLAEPFNIEWYFVETSGGEDMAAALETMYTAGVQGVLCLGGVSEAMVQQAQKYNAAIGSFCAIIPEETLKVLATYDNFVGNVCEDEQATGSRSAEAMYNAGCRNVGVLGLTKGLAMMHDVRCESFIERFKELGGNIVAEDYSMLDFAKAISTFAAAYPEMDGLWCTLMNEAIFQTVVTEDLLGTVKLAGFDLSESSKTYFDNGTLLFAASGQQGTIMAGFAILYNYIYDGTYIIEDRTKTVPRNFLEVTTSDEYQIYEDYVRFSTCYSPTEIGFMIKGLNPDYTYQDFEEMNLSFSLEDVKARTLGE